MTGVLKVRTTKEFGESTVSKILDLVENSSSKKSKSENFISKFARFYTPIVCLGAVLLAFVPPLVRLCFMGLAPQFDVDIQGAYVSCNQLSMCACYKYSVKFFCRNRRSEQRRRTC